uniref:enoyl-[acyl-carrier-protein] reductase n=1 Tax=Paramoeba aestuarina TaxID=180227 RepID=A0A7S4L2U0_9EUKA|mmetsp:Transcript_30493/g.47383  ORF Transcript_30493/g.47383 Transcript_30493/m.47383 type:complete len:351 (+) Transcript_30493:107-1159(+)|eukprot:CAMPEP_0201540368 /NCGR_PEP_ID=MMETSP0161_2-20130828/70906_1 /ASSEMBLY_ACC=CAM_ASM_000251 /TAXON_ID=180227 /ORGANISM="Neoparamoeba aestuarina, Strain SoJaBio B1-5/56/2" /LENGTH=350 /DNA_ID=CAMNT_0047947831 /DNA_START=86 /DNA_END=1138 /DNA_ORIENTATION=+
MLGLRSGSLLVRRWASGRALVFDKFGPPMSVLRLEDSADAPAPKNGEVKIKMIAAPVSLFDADHIKGSLPTSSPGVGGGDGVGVIEQVGEGVEGFKVGDTVIPHGPEFGGTWRTHATVSSSSILSVPSSLPPPYAATLGVSLSTAHLLLTEFENLKEGDVVVQNGGSGLVAQLVVQLAAKKGIKTITLVRERHDYADTVERIKAYGGYVVVQDSYTKGPDFKKLIADLPAPKLALNSAGGDSATEMARILAPGATMVTYGNSSKDHLKLPASLFLFNDIKLRGFNHQQWVENHTKQERQELINDLAGQIGEEEGGLRFWLQTHRLSDWEEALEKALYTQKNRKVVMILDK